MGRRRRPETITGVTFKLIMQVAGILAATIVCGLALAVLAFVAVLRFV